MGREALDAAAGIVATRAALVAAAIAVIVLLPAFLAGILEHTGRASHAAALLRRVSPPLMQRIAAVAISVCVAAAFSGRIGASGADTGTGSVSEWLRNGDQPPPTTRSEEPASRSRASGTWYADPSDPTAPGDQPETGGSEGEFLPTTTIELEPSPPTTSAPLPPSGDLPVPTTTSSPVRPTSALVTATPRGPDASGSTVEYVVVPGDCLWTIAAHRLGTLATAADVDREWRRIYEVNRARIGANPSLILPGQRLDLPPLSNP